MLSKPFDSLDSYVAYFRSVEFPVLRRTERELAELKEVEDRLSARQIAGVVLQDPLMALNLLIHLQRHRSRSQNHDITTIDRAIMMLGVTPFFTRFGALATLEDQLAAYPKALVGVLKVIARAKRAAQYARDWAILRHDIDVDEITVAALLHDIAEIACWCFAPDLIQGAYQLQKANPGMRSAVAQRSVMCITMADLQVALVREYGLPELLVTLMDPAYSSNPREQTVALASDLSRHVSNGWDDPALPDDIRQIAELLHLAPSVLLQRMGVPPGPLVELFPDVSPDSGA